MQRYPHPRNELEYMKEHTVRALRFTKRLRKNNWNRYTRTLYTSRMSYAMDLLHDTLEVYKRDKTLA